MKEAPRTLFDPAPAQRHSPTSVAAAESVQPHAGTQRAAVLEYIRGRGVDGATDEEIAEALAISGNAARPRRIELLTARLVCDSGRTRATHSGRDAVVWKAV